MDVVLVLLIIFMVVTPLLEKDLEVLVPHTEQLPEEVEIPQDQIVVSLGPQSQLSINDAPVDEQSYVSALKAQLDAKGHGTRLVFFNADDHANYGRVVVALDGARQAGAVTLGMMTEAIPTEPASTATPSPNR